MVRSAAVPVPHKRAARKTALVELGQVFSHCEWGIAPVLLKRINGNAEPHPFMATRTETSSVLSPILRDAAGRVYAPAVGPRLKVLLAGILFCVALLGATGAYLFALRVFGWVRGFDQVTLFALWITLAHIFAGIILVAPFLIFGAVHLIAARRRTNRRAVRLGIALFAVGIAAGLSGLALIQIEGLPQLPTETLARSAMLVAHIVTPLGAVFLYVLHRRAGPKIRWDWGIGWGTLVGSFVLVMMVMHSFDPRKVYVKGSPEGEKYFEPSKARTVAGNFISQHALLMDEYCLKCHADIYQGHLHSAHKFSSFNNPAYSFSVLETRRVAKQRDGNTRASRWCAGCHDPVPFFSGAFDDPVFDDPKFDVSNHPTAAAGITCTVCHGIVHVNSRIGNADYTIEEPLHYPFAYSSNSVLQWVNNQLVKAKPELHKRTFLKDFHKDEAFCSTCHKVGLPMEVNHYKEFLRGQNHNDPFLLSGVSGHSARSFYYPPIAKTNCAACHMPLHESRDFGARDFDGSGSRKIHSHLFPAANTGVPALMKFPGYEESIAARERFLRGSDPAGKDRPVRIDIFGLKKGGTIDGELLAPLRPELPPLEPGRSYLVEVVIRTLNIGHPLTQGTVDSNELWVEFEAQAGTRLLGRSGALQNDDDSGPVDEWAHFINVLMLDRNGLRIDRRNPQDIFTPLYNHQIPPGAAQIVHYRLDVPADVRENVRLKTRLRYRKFDYPYMKHVYGNNVPKLPIVDLCEDEILLPIGGAAGQPASQKSPIEPAWQRWNDYGIGCLLEGGVGAKKGELRQARAAFGKLLDLEEKNAIGHAHLNLARVAFEEGLLEDAVQELNRARQAEPPAPWWTVAWFNGLVNAQNNHLDEAIADFEKILDPSNQPRERKFDFTKDYVVLNELGRTLFMRSQKEDNREARDGFLRRAVEQYEMTLEIDPEDLDAHYGLAQCYTLLGAAFTTPMDEALSRREARELGGIIAATTEPPTTRLQAAAALQGALARHREQPSRPDRPKLPLLLGLMADCRPVYQQATQPELRAAAARLLGELHLQAHGVYKPDELAEARSRRLYREAHPAANHAAEAIVIYPLSR